MVFYQQILDKKIIWYFWKITINKIYYMDNKKIKKVDGTFDQSPTDLVRQAEKITHNEKIDIDIGDVIRCYPEDIPRIIYSYKDWSRQWDI